jgi:hypothetical protein
MPAPWGRGDKMRKGHKWRQKGAWGVYIYVMWQGKKFNFVEGSISQGCGAETSCCGTSSGSDLKKFRLRSRSLLRLQLVSTCWRDFIPAPAPALVKSFGSLRLRLCNTGIADPKLFFLIRHAFRERGDGLILLWSKLLQRDTSTKMNNFGAFSEFLCLR